MIYFIIGCLAGYVIGIALLALVSANDGNHENDNHENDIENILFMIDNLAHNTPDYLEGNEVDVWHDALAEAYKKIKIWKS